MTKESPSISRRLTLPFSMLLAAVLAVIAASMLSMEHGREGVIDELQALTSNNAKHLGNALQNRLQLIRNAARIPESHLARGRDI
ncbi:MAG: hypothetical protein MJ061_07180, partial [Mailhella sp.]|nr:hypothetical protein [Mailhella sp.]